ncbi:MAG TPA: biotin/lipoyl-containing protein, partial [candidate division Zixibacteria bacterium]|nr:biotin/lipoyl-containing protein [candidate division Zixibacteria bacterium]
LAQLRKTAVMSSGGSADKLIKAPMPGLILEVKVQPGDVVKKNQPIMIVEAMKMENIIKAPADGTIKTVHISNGQSVEKDMKLVEFE